MGRLYVPPGGNLRNAVLVTLGSAKSLRHILPPLADLKPRGDLGPSLTKKVRQGIPPRPEHAGVVLLSFPFCIATGGTFTIQLFDAKHNTPLGYISNTLDSGYLMIAPEGDAAVLLEVFYNCGSATSGVLVLPVSLGQPSRSWL